MSRVLIKNDFKLGCKNKEFCGRLAVIFAEKSHNFIRIIICKDKCYLKSFWASLLHALRSNTRFARHCEEETTKQSSVKALYLDCFVPRKSLIRQCEASQRRKATIRRKAAEQTCHILSPLRGSDLYHTSYPKGLKPPAYHPSSLRDYAEPRRGDRIISRR